ncbi:hypothetical protein [Acuticoccus sp.]|uniref:hypothetical protein n=1 Tax=Acuticoccus sp. TaxID=1904378 RepID=UPI003B51A56C
MATEPDSLVSEILRELRAEMREMRAETRELKERLGRVETRLDDLAEATASLPFSASSPENHALPTMESAERHLVPREE